MDTRFDVMWYARQYVLKHQQTLKLYVSVAVLSGILTINWNITKTGQSATINVTSTFLEEQMDEQLPNIENCAVCRARVQTVT